MTFNTVSTSELKPHETSSDYELRRPDVFGQNQLTSEHKYARRIATWLNFTEQIRSTAQLDLEVARGIRSFLLNKEITSFVHFFFLQKFTSLDHFWFAGQGGNPEVIENTIFQSASPTSLPMYPGIPHSVDLYI